MLSLLLNLATSKGAIEVLLGVWNGMTAVDWEDIDSTNWETWDSRSDS